MYGNARTTDTQWSINSRLCSVEAAAQMATPAKVKQDEFSELLYARQENGWVAMR